MAETVLHIGGNRSYILEFERSLFLFDPGFDATRLPEEGGQVTDSSTLVRLEQLIEKTRKPLTHLLVSHHHEDHARNLSWFFELKRRSPRAYPFNLIMHERFPGDWPAMRLGLDTRVQIEGEELWVLMTPGHTGRMTDIALWYPQEALLFAGDMIQPQGLTYGDCSFVTPVSNHKRPALAIQSLHKLRSLPFKLILQGHEGEILNSLAGVNAIDITLTVLERTRELARQYTTQFPGEDRDAYVDVIFETLCQERGLGKSQAAERRGMGHQGPCEWNARESYFNLYDAPSIRSFVNEILGGQPVGGLL